MCIHHWPKLVRMNPLPQICNLALNTIGPLLSSYSLLTKSRNSDHLSAQLVAFTTDSRQASCSTGFIAYEGVANDGHRFIAAAVSAKAAFIICEKSSIEFAGLDIPIFIVSSGRAAWSVLSAKSCGNPETKLKMIGITGTNGKTSTAWMARQLLVGAGVKVAMVGTLGAWIGEEFFETNHTTPDPDYFYPFLKRAVEANAVACVMEVSSHAIAQDKLLPVAFSAVAFTSFSRDHLDFHKSELAYWETKCRLLGKMSLPGAQKFICTGLPKFPTNSNGATTLYGFAAPHSTFPAGLPQLWPVVKEEALSGTTLALKAEKRPDISGKIPFFGAHALENFTVALLLASTLSDKVWDPSLWQKVQQVPGRLERIDGKSGRIAFVDYAHTPDALEKTLVFLKKYTKHKLLVVFGCGGDRDPGKRPIMGKIAETQADRVFVTSDNPRTEDPSKILQDILAGMNGANTEIFLDRRQAIQAAVNASESNDVILIAGKGHETYQIVSDKVLPFDDRETAREFMKS